MKVVIRSSFSNLLLAPLLLSFFGCSSSTPTQAPSDPTSTDTSPVSAPVALTSPTVAPAPKAPKSAAQVQYLYGNWKQSWADMRIDDFMAFYSKKVRSGKVGYAGIRERKIRQWAKESYIQITDVGQPKIQVKGDRAVLSALQVYDSTTWWDKGVKTLEWQKSGGKWLIVGERFTAYSQKAKAQPTATPGHPDELDVTKYQIVPPDSDADTDTSDFDTSSIDTSSSSNFDSSSGSSSGGSSYLGPQDEGGACSAGAMAICNDGTTSYSANRRGTCSHHGGVARWCP